MTKICKKCNVDKNIWDFYFIKKINKFSSWCKACQKNRAVQSRKQFVSSDNPKDILTKRFYYLLSSIDQHSKNKKMKHSITMKFLRAQYNKQLGKCYYTGVSMKIKKRGEQLYNPFDISLDRIDSNDGYTPTNSVLCCLGINLMKSINSPEIMYDSLKTFYEGYQKKIKM